MTGRFDLEAGQEWLDGRFSHFTVWLACNSGLKPAFGLLELRFAACPVMVHIPIIAGKHQGTSVAGRDMAGNPNRICVSKFAIQKGLNCAYFQTIFSHNVSFPILP